MEATITKIHVTMARGSSLFSIFLLLKSMPFLQTHNDRRQTIRHDEYRAEVCKETPNYIEEGYFLRSDQRFLVSPLSLAFLCQWKSVGPQTVALIMLYHRKAIHRSYSV